MPGPVVRVSIVCPPNMSLPNGHRECTMPAVEKSLGNSKPEAATMATVLQKRRRNSSCAVAALPSELLSIVFSMNVLSDRPGQKNGKHNLGWISATQVCHRWREIALATSTLWRYLDFACMSRRWCSEMLRRSGNCSLEVALRITSPLDPCPVLTSLSAARELVKPEYSGRLAGLHLELGSQNKRDVDSFINSLQQSAPRLEYLALQRTSWTWELLTVSSFTSRLPSLKRLRLNNIFLSPWVSPILTSLEELDISFRTPSSRNSLISYGEMSSILRRMPELRRLVLRNVFRDGTHTDGMLNGHISLPNLQQLSLIDEQGCDLFSFAASLRLPSETCAEIKTNGRAWVDTILPQYELTFGLVRRLKLLVNGCPQVQLEFRSSDALAVERSAPAQLRLAYSLLPSFPPPPHATSSPLPPPSRIAHHFGAARLHLDGLLYLDIASHVPWPADCWRALFVHATRLHQVRATYRGAVDGLLLQVFLAADESRLLPSLRSVKLSLVDLDEAIDAVDPPRARGDLLLDGLTRRRDLLGSEMIWELEVPDQDGCWVEKLRLIVPGVLHA